MIIFVMIQINTISIYQHTTETCANNNNNTNSKTKICKGETTKVISKLRSLSLARNFTERWIMIKERQQNKENCIRKRLCKRFGLGVVVFDAFGTVKIQQTLKFWDFWKMVLNWIWT